MARIWVFIATCGWRHSINCAAKQLGVCRVLLALWHLCLGRFNQQEPLAARQGFSPVKL